jgi:hypothetical protein
VRIFRLLIVSCILICALHAAAQSTQVFVTQTEGWRAHSGDDPAWASPEFDDSSWTTISLDRAAFPREFIAGHSRWFRKRIHLPAQPGPMQLVVSALDGSYEVYVDGRRVSPPVQSSFRWQADVTRIFALSAAAGSGQDVQVAIRSHLYDQPFWDSWPPVVAVASPAAAKGWKSARDGARLGSGIFFLGVNLLTTLASLIVLTLYFQQRGHREYLWLGLCMLSLGLTNLLISTQYYLPISLNGFLGDPCEYWFIAAQIQLVYAFVSRKPPRAVRLYQWAMIALPFVLNPIAWSGGANVVFYSWLENGLVLPGMIVSIGVLIAWAVRGNREAAMLLAPMFLANVGALFIDIDSAAVYLNSSWKGMPTLRLGMVVFSFQAVAEALFLLAIGLVIFLRFVRISREQVRTQAEIEAARAVQQVLIPDTLPSVPGFHVDSVYRPAQQVGGDFFQIIPLPDGGVLTVVGDVSGKGMPAALTVALVVGTLRTLVETTSSPAEILAGLNRRLDGRSTGFTTCVAVRILPNGEATLASAGHLNPYISSQDAAPREIHVAAGLPLGLAADSAYADAPLALAPGETITFLSDGVVEARNQRGELFGFERTCAVAARPADQIARTAEDFG